MRDRPHWPRSLWCWALACLVLPGCFAPRKGQDARRTGSVEEIGRRLAEGGAKPVRGTVAEGIAPPEGDSFALADPEDLAALEAAPQAPEDAEPEQEEDDTELFLDPYLRFGERIILKESAGELFITKPYSMPPGRADKLVALMAALEPFPFRPRPQPDKETGEAPLDVEYVDYQVLANWDEEYYSNLQAPVPAQAQPVALSDIFVVTAAYDRLEEFEDFLNLFAAAGVPQIELEAKIIEIVETDTRDVGFNSSFTFGARNFVQALDFAFPNISTGSEAIIDLGAVQDDSVFDAVVDLIQTWDNVQIESQGKIAVRAGGVASIDSTTEFPYLEAKGLTDQGTFTTSTNYKKIGTQLYISPRVIGTKTLALEVHLIGSQQVGGTIIASSGNAFIESPIIAYRTARTVVYLEPGQTLVIGGLTQEREQELVSKVPLLGDIPLIKHLFRSTFTQKERQTVLFAISPRIIQRSDLETEF